jgi:predicted DNA-binding protein with PD1-like motif
VIVFQSRKTKRLLCRLGRGEDLVESLLALATADNARAAWVRGVGTLEWAELGRYDQVRRTAEAPQRFATPCELLSLDGHLALTDGTLTAQLHATLSRRTDNGVEVLGGELLRAGVFDCQVVVEILEDVRLERWPDEETGLRTWAGGKERPSVRAESAPPPAPTSWVAPVDEEEDDEDEDDAPSVGGVSWADVAAASAEPAVVPVERGRGKKKVRPVLGDVPAPPTPTLPGKRTRKEQEQSRDDWFPEKGDWIDHKQFGLCKVEREDTEGGLTIALPSGRRKTIKLDFMEVLEPVEESGKRIYPVRPKKRR